jgi:hypothetical protein
MIYKKGIAYLCLFLVTLIPAFKSHASTYQVSMTPTASYFDYKEFSADSDVLNNEHGVLYGFNFLLGVNPFPKHKFQYEYSILTGRVKYDGYTQSYQKHRTQTDERFDEYELYYWHDLSNYNFGLSVAYAKWDRYIRPKNNVLGLKEIYSWKKISINQSYKIEDIVLMASLSHLIDAEVEVDLSEVNMEHLVVDMPSGNEITLASGYTKNITNGFSIITKATFTWRYFEKSRLSEASGRTFLEPENEVFISALALEFQYEF